MLVGPSAGHCLPLEHLARFERLLLLEPDGLARVLIRRRLGARRVVHRRDDLLVSPLLRGAPGLDDLLRDRPRAAVLFCNLLGQLQFGLSNDQHDSWREAFQRRILPALSGRRWASFHDRWSLEGPSGERPPAVELQFTQAPSDQELGAALFGAAGPPLQVLDHGTAGLFPELGPHRYFTWQLTPQVLHVVEAVNG